ncbi:DUF6603 domain-containing protein [Piscinibacter koreensis]|uniref:DUF6603 domain-containing protein n=1 Tax=Piscinibacter koreensis TaxID=2742824 RepID=A0A7Y6TYK9_9BURK|nr:DUF6603 domain-containing protein [Schlegelella koreensis]NUZ08358.1 hypothetical protein [Schlegelella koreensis]
MAVGKSDLGVLGDLAVALGIFRADGSPDPDWLSDPAAALKSMLSNGDQRRALIAFVDAALGGADRSTEAGVIWLPLIEVPDPPLLFALILDEGRADGLHVGLGIRVRTAPPAPVSSTTLAVPLFRVTKEGGPPVGDPLLLGSNDGRIRIATRVTLDAAAPVPGQARLGGIGLEIDVPTGTGGSNRPLFALALDGLQLPGATAPQDVRLAADGAGGGDDAVLALVLGLVKAQADAAAASPPIAALGGLLGLRSGDAVPDFPVAALLAHGPIALAEWVRGIFSAAPSRADWLGHLASLLGATPSSDRVTFTLGSANVVLGLELDAGPSGNPRLTPTLAVDLGNAATRVEARAGLFRVDLVSGAAVALPSLGVWAAAGNGASPVLDLATPTVARAETLRIGFALDAARKPVFVLAADRVLLGSQAYPTLDLSSPDAVMDAAGASVEAIASDLLGGLGDALGIARRLIGLDPPTGVAAVTLPALMADPVDAVAGYWHQLIGVPAAVTEVLGELRSALADASEAAGAVRGAGTQADPWRLALIGPLGLEVAVDGATLHLGLATVTNVNSLGGGCTVVTTRFAARLARIDLAARRGELLPGVAASLTVRERGVSPPQARLQLGGGLALRADHVGLAFGWSPATRLTAELVAPHLVLETDTLELPIALPQVAADGSVTLPPEGWDGVEALVGPLGRLAGGLLGRVVDAFGWAGDGVRPGGDPDRFARLRLADLAVDARAALAGWLPRLALSDRVGDAMALLADLFATTSAGAGRFARGVVEGTGHPDDPYRFGLGAHLPNVALWFPPAGLDPALFGAPVSLRDWRPGFDGLGPSALAAALRTEAAAARDVRELVFGRDLDGGLAALAQRWLGGDGRIVPPAVAPDGIGVRTLAVGAAQLVSTFDGERELGRVPTTTVYVALAQDRIAPPPGARVVDLSTPGLAASMFPGPAALAAGDWYVQLGSRADCRGADGASDGTPEQAARLARVLDALAPVSGSDIAVVAFAGAGHAARLAVDAQAAVADLLLLGTPLAAISLTAVAIQPTADALRLLHRLLPAVDPDEPDDADLALGRALVQALMELAPLPDPGADLRPAVLPAPAVRAGLRVQALFGEVDAAAIARAMTAIVAAGLAGRARARSASEPPSATGVEAGLRWTLPEVASGSVAIGGFASLALFGFDADTAAISRPGDLRVTLRITDRIGWLAASPDLELRALTLEFAVLLARGEGAAASGRTRLVLHDARVFGQSWEALVVGAGDLGAAGVGEAVLPEARVLVSAALQRVTSDFEGAASRALADLLRVLGLVAPNGGVVAGALDQLVFDPAGLLRQRLAIAADEVQAALGLLLGPALAAGLDLASRRVHVQGGGADATRGGGRFGWQADLTASFDGAAPRLSGSFAIGPSAALPTTGGLQLRGSLAAGQPPALTLHWHAAGGAGSRSAALWPQPDGAALLRMLAGAAPAIGGHVALEMLRGLDASARPLIDAALDAFGMLDGAAGDAERALRPLAGLLADPAGWLSSAGSLAASPLKIQTLCDALRPLTGAAGSPGGPLRLATGVALRVVADGAGARLTLGVDPTSWTAAPGGAARLSAGVAASLRIGVGSAPVPGLDLFVGAPGAGVEPGRCAVHVRTGAGGLEVFARPTSGADIALLPFAGFGALSAVAEAALPFLLDKLAATPAPVGPLVGELGDALALRTGTPPGFDRARLQAWAADPAGALSGAVPTLASHGLAALATRVQPFVPAGVAVTASAGALGVSVAGVSLSWSPTAGSLALAADAIAVPGVEHLAFKVVASAAGLMEFTLALGPADIDAGGVRIRPFVAVSAGLAPPLGRRVAVGLAVDDTHRLASRWSLDSGSFALTASDGALAAPVDSADAVQVALRTVEVAADLVATVALAQAPVQSLLGRRLGATPTDDVRALLRGVLLVDQPSPNALIGGAFDPAAWPARLRRLFGNLAGLGIVVDLGALTIAFAKGGSSSDVIGLRLAVDDRFELISGDTVLWLENDDRWIVPDPSASSDGGLFVGFLRDGALEFRPTLVVEGVGLRLGRRSGPLLDAGVTLESIALHAYAEIDAAGGGSPFKGGGLQIQFSNLAVGAAGGGGSNRIAQGLLRDTGPKPPRPAFSPALAIQKHGSGPLAVTLSAGEGAGPWWVAIQKGFGPLYLEQVGFGVTHPGGRVERVSLLMDGSVSLFGLTCAVDDLEITYIVSNGAFFDPNSWSIDLAGLAVAADMAGVSLTGGLLKQSGPQGIEYLGMLLGRFAVYGLTVYGGYGEGRDAQNDKFTAFFAIGAVNGPIGGPPAFFLTGIGGGFGINRKLVLPADLARFGEYPLIQALDIAARPSDPMALLRQLGNHFPMNKGTFWFAAGLAFNSFALVDGIAVVGVQVGDGLDVNLLGLGRMALPRPEAALVSIEVALLVRFSSREGVLWVQGQLTDNSWLLYRDVKLTGGFAYVIWFKGEHAGEFVFTLGGYHPDFRRNGYPVVPRLGLRWSIGSAITIKSGTYFALTSEALMAGGDFEASAKIGPGWAELTFGAHGIVFFDPFSYDVKAYVRIRAGVTIDTWLFGVITISVSLGARIHVQGPDFRARVTFEVGPVELTFRFGDADRAQLEPLSAQAFVAKYLDAADNGKARPHAVMTNTGALPSKGEQSTPDGSAARPFVVVVEFSITLTSQVPATGVRRVGAPVTRLFTSHPPSRALGVAPRKIGSVEPELKLTWLRNGVPQAWPFVDRVRPFGRFPLGIWGQPQDPNQPKIPKGEMVDALSELDIACVASPSGGGPEIAYHQVEIGPRRPLPFSRKPAEVSAIRGVADAVSALVAVPASVDAAFSTATRFLGRTASPTALAALRGERQAPPLVGTLTEGLESAVATVVPAIGAARPAKVFDHFVDPPVAVALLAPAALALSAAPERALARTTVKGSDKAWRVAAPTLAKVEAERSRSIAARLVRVDDPAVPTGGLVPGAVTAIRTGTLIAARQVPPTAPGHAPSALVARPGAALAEPLAAFGAALAAPALRGKRAAARAPNAGATLAAGQIAVLALPNAHADAATDAARPRLVVRAALARVVLVDAGGARLADVIAGPGASTDAVEIVRGTERIVAIGLGAAPSARSADRAATQRATRALAAVRAAADATAALVGWHAGTSMPYAGSGVAVGPGVVVHASGEPLALHRERRAAGWVGGVELAQGVSTVATTFAAPVRTVLIALDDPSAAGAPLADRQLLLGLDGATRVRDAGIERAPVLLSADNRSVLAYDVRPDAAEAERVTQPVVVTVASRRDWSLVGVMGSASLDAAGAIALVAARGLDAALDPLVPPAPPGSVAPASVLAWDGPVRSDAERALARARATARAAPDALPRALGARRAAPDALPRALGARRAAPDALPRALGARRAAPNDARASRARARAIKT